MTIERFVTSRLSLSRLRAIRPALIETIDFEAILAERLADLQVRLPDVDTLGLETEPLVALQQADAYREMLDLARINDKVRGLLAAFATGTDLDHVAALAGMRRLVLTRDENGDPATYEDDETLRMRYFAGFSAPAAGSEDGYIGAALAAYPQAADIVALGPAVHDQPGRVDIVALAPAGGTVPSGTLIAIREACNAKSVRPLTDWIAVLSAIVVPYTVTITAEINAGPDPALFAEAVRATAQATADERYIVGGEVPAAAMTAAAISNGALAATAVFAWSGGSGGIPRDPYKAPFATGIVVNVIERGL